MYLRAGQLYTVTDNPPSDPLPLNPPAIKRASR
jgi:hypothetical protein